MGGIDPTSLSTYGAKFIVEPEGPRLSESEKELLGLLKPAGIILRKRNFLSGASYTDWLEEYRGLVSDLRNAVARDNLLLCIDHEGGRVIRPPEPITRFPYPSKWSGRTAEVASAMAAELRSLAVNVTFSPVADIHSNPNNPVINQRAFGRTPQEVVAGSSAFAKTMQREGILPCAKHFPGHGDTSTDSHYVLPVLDLPVQTLRERELVPFKALIDQNIPLIMTAHLIVRSLDPENMATLSQRILGDLLRKELGFEGVIVADAMGMKAIIDQLERPESTAQALNAGLDLFCVAGDDVTLEHALRWAGYMRDAVCQGLVPEEELSLSLERIERLAAAAPQYHVEKLDQECFSPHRALAEELNERPDWGSFDLHLPGFE